MKKGYLPHASIVAASALMDRFATICGDTNLITRRYDDSRMYEYMLYSKRAFPRERTRDELSL